MRTGRPKAALVLSAEQRDELERWVRRRRTAQPLAMRARIILSCAEGGSNTDVAGRLGVSRLTVGRWRSRFIRSGVDGLLDEPRPGAPRTISDAAVEKAVTLTDATHWSTPVSGEASRPQPQQRRADWARLRLAPSPQQELSTDHSEKSSKTFCCPVSPSARRTASWKS